ncbi:MOSC domain-containing protein [Streptomyces antibioticus]|uniref:MOSC domain-containing protein n=1 Tax=Streptomyces antibioticus TaxID=1890 RepID=UPI00368AF94A
MAGLTAITYYPVKGCAGVTLTEAAVTPTGLADDRRYAVADGNGELRWQGADPRLALIAPELLDGELTLRFPGHEPVRAGHDDVDAWLTRVLGRPSRLIRPPAGNHGRLHVVSRASLDDLNARLTAAGSDPLPMNRFRPNLVVDGWDAPHTEDEASVLTVGGVELALTERTVRCAVTMVDQDTGRKAGPEPLRTLAGHRRADGGVVFGAYFRVLRPGKVSVGDEVGVRA